MPRKKRPENMPTQKTLERAQETLNERLKASIKALRASVKALITDIDVGLKSRSLKGEK